MKVVLSPNPYRDRGLRAAQAAEKILRNVGVETAMCLPFLLEGSNLEFPKHRNESAILNYSIADFFVKKYIQII